VSAPPSDGGAVDGGAGPVAVVTGAARGIGAAVARRLASEGWRVALVDACADDPAIPMRMATREDLRATAAACGPGALAVLADVRDQAALDDAVAQARARFGRVDAAVAAAGAVAGGPPAWECDDATWDALLGINLGGVWRLCRAAVPDLLRSPLPGRFVAVASVAGLRGLPSLAAYTAAKHGVVGLVRALAAELGPSGVTANAVAPGSTDTAMLTASAAVYGLADTGEFARHHRLGRLLRPEEVAAAVAWLCGPDTAGVTGTVLPVDAGMTA